MNQPHVTKIVALSEVDQGADDDQEPEVTDESSGDGRRVGPYEILETLGDGGMGLVYKVRHCGAGTTLAMKVLRSELAMDPVNVKRFRQEMKTTSLLNHANVVATYDSGVTDEGAPYLVMEYVDGYNVQQILEQEGYLDLDRFFHLFGQVCDALIHAHAKRVIHRDLKPSNIMVAVTDSGFELAKLVDFGIARVFQRPSANGNGTGRLTQMGDVLGSPVYMSPEQCLNQKLDERSDVYSLGVVMYEALVGAPPFAAENAVEVIMGHLQQKPPSLSKMRPDFNLPPDLEALIYACLEKEPALRVQSVEDLATELKRISISARSGGFVRSIKQIPRRIASSMRRSWRKIHKSRHKLAKPAAAVLFLGALAYGGYEQWVAPHYTVNDYIDKATLSLTKLDYDSVAANWDQAIKLAIKEGVARAKLAHLYEQAADELASSVQTNIQLPSQMGWTTLMPQRYQQNEAALQASLAKPYLQHAWDLQTALHNNVESMRILDKLIDVSDTMQDLQTEEDLLHKRILMAEDSSHNGSGVNAQAYRRLSQLLTTRGKIAEAEALLKKEVQVEQLQNSRPYPNSMEELASLYHRTDRFADEIKLLQYMVANLREECLEQPQSYEDQLMRHLNSLASALRRQGRTAEAEDALVQAGHIKARILARSTQ